MNLFLSKCSIMQRMHKKGGKMIVLQCNLISHIGTQIPTTVTPEVCYVLMPKVNNDKLLIWGCVDPIIVYYGGWRG